MRARLGLPWSTCVLAVLAGCGGPRPSLRLVSARALGVVRQGPDIVGRDGGASGLCFGRSVWAFGDTVLRMADGDGQTWHHNSLAQVDPAVWAGRVPGTLPLLDDPLDGHGAPRYLVPPTADEAAFNADHAGEPCRVQPCGARFAVWPGAPVWDEQGQRAIIPYSLIRAAPGDFNFSGVGDSIAIWRRFEDAPERPVVAPGSEHPTVLFPAGGWPEAAQVVDGFLVAFACPQRGLGHACRIGRAPLDRVLEAGAWQAWAGGRWVEGARGGDDLFGAGPNVSVFRFPPEGPWVAVYGAPLSNDVKLRTATALTGPWSDEETLFSATRPGGGFTYDAYVHPELAEAGGAVQYLTYSRSNGDGWFGSELALVRLELAPR